MVPFQQVVLRGHLLVILSYVLLACLLTLPLLSRFATHVPGDGGDDPALTWNLWWVRFSLLQGLNLFQCDYMFFPIGINLAFYTLTVLNGFLSAPLQAVLGLASVSNLILLSSYVLGAYGAYLLALYLRLGRGAAWLAGVVFAFAAPKMFYAALGQFNIASSQWIPFTVLYMLKVVHGRDKRNALLAALWLALQTWAEMTYASFLLVFLGLLLAWELSAALLSGKETLLRFLPSRFVSVVLMVVVFLLLIAPLLFYMLPDMLGEEDFSVVGGGFADVFSADLVGYLVPTILHPWFGSLVKRFSFENYNVGQHVYFGLSVWALAAIAFVDRRKRQQAWFWFLCALAFLVLTLGPVLQINGRILDIPMPFQVFQELPFFKANRYPSRYAVMLALCLSLLGAQGLQMLARRLKYRRLWRYAPGLLAGLFLIENLSVPLPLSDMRVPAAYSLIRSQPGDFAILDIPVGWRNGFRITGAHDVAIMFAQYYQTYHEKRLLGGNTSRNPEFKFQYFTEMPVLRSIIAYEAGKDVPEEMVVEDRERASQVLAGLGVRYIVLHSAIAEEELSRYVESVLPVGLVGQQDGVRVYAVIPEESHEYEVDPKVVLGEGWGARRFPAVAVRAHAQLLLPGGGEARISLQLRGMGDSKLLQVEQGGYNVGACELSDAWSECRLDLPATDQPVRCLWLVSDGNIGADEWHPQVPIGETGVVSPVDILVRSAGEEFGDFGHIYVNGRDYSPNERGYNIVAVSPGDGSLVSSAAFDTHISASASDGMAAYLNSLPEGVIVAVAAADEASRSLTEMAVMALSRLGSETDLRGCFRCGHALVGVVGAVPGSAQEQWGIGVQEVVVGLGLTEPNLYFQLGGVHFVELSSSGERSR